MNLFINAISELGTLILFNNKRQIISQKDIKVLGNESSKLISIIDKFLDENNHVYNDISNIVVIHWPWSFTWVRTIVLAINSINFIIQKNITALSFFDLFDSYPIIKNSSRRDLFVKFNKSDTIEIVKNDDFIFSWKIYWDIWNNILSEKLQTVWDINYQKIIKDLEFQENRLIEPLYIKKPSIS